MDHRLFGLAAAAALTVASVSQARQPTPAPKPPPKPAEAVEGVTVTGPANGMRTSIDRRSYSVGQDLQAASGSVADALRSIPSVEVDVQGNVSLRGDANVTIMIDGKPSGMFRGPGAGDALQQFPADQIERVEVITNPSAAFKADGTAGIINLVTKKTRGAGWAGSVRGNLGSGGRYNGGVSLAYNAPKLTVAADVALRRDDQKQVFVDRRLRTDPLTGVSRETRQDSLMTGGHDLATGRFSADYDLDAKTRISGELRVFAMDFAHRGFEHYEADQAAGVVIRDRVGRATFERTSVEGSASYRRKFAGDGHELVIDASRERSENDGYRRYGIRQVSPVALDSYEDISTPFLAYDTEFKIDYTRPLPGEAKLKAGYEFELEDLDNEALGLRGPDPQTAVLDPTLTNRFLHEQAIHTLYGTYERPFGDLTVLAGLRLEQVRMEIDQVTSGVRAETDYTRAYPSLHMAYRLDEEQQVTLSYSHRVSRPQAGDLNPFRTYVDLLNFREGNPRLKPQDTHSYEAAFQRRSGQTYYLATLYYRQSSNGVTDVVRDLGGGVLLTTKANLARSRSGGLELTANGKLTPKLSYNVSGNVFWNEIDASSLGFADPRSAYTLSGRANLTWQATPEDLFQVNGFVNAKRLTAQGYREPFGLLNLGYRRKLSDDLSAVVTVQDLLNSAKDVQVFDTPTLRGRSEREFQGRTLFVGLTYSFGGGRRPRDQGFDFGGGPP